MKTLHLRIGRIVVDAPSGTDRRALARELAASLPAALQRKLGTEQRTSGVRSCADSDSLAGRIADAITPRIESHGGDR